MNSYHIQIGQQMFVLMNKWFHYTFQCTFNVLFNNLAASALLVICKSSRLKGLKHTCYMAQVLLFKQRCTHMTCPFVCNVNEVGVTVKNKIVVSAPNFPHAPISRLLQYTRLQTHIFNSLILSLVDLVVSKSHACYLPGSAG